MLLHLVEEDHEALLNECEPFDFADPQIDPQELAVALVEHMGKWNGLGLAANQVGIKYRVFALHGDPAFVCFNPRVVQPSSDEIYLEEGCLSYPGLVVKVKRPRSVKVRFEGPDGETYTMTWTGMTARAFQHELDHLDGVPFYRRASRFHLESAMKKYRKFQKQLSKFESFFNGNNNPVVIDS